MLRIPSELSIKGHLWTVKYKWRLVDDDDHPCDGLCVTNERTIYLAHGLGEDKATVFLHEWAHAVMFESGLYVTSLSKDVEEMVCQAIATELATKFKLRWRKVL